MRRFSSYGPVDTDLHYYVPRSTLVENAVRQLVGENPTKGGHYITVWAPRQRGKTWIMTQVSQMLQKSPQYAGFDVIVLSLEHLKMETDVQAVIASIGTEITDSLGLESAPVKSVPDFYHLFRRNTLSKPLILILDEFDSLPEGAISSMAGVFKNIHGNRQFQANRPTAERDYLLHGVALVGVRSVLGIENVTGSPFNIQQSLHVPNLTADEVARMFQWYERESGQRVDATVVERVFYETQGQPGLVSWLGELLTENYNEHGSTITMRDFETAYAAAVDALPNANVLNIISKAKQFPTGNGKIDLIIRYAGRVYGLELKSFTDAFGYRNALTQAARYACQLGLSEITLVLFVDAVDATNREKYEATHVDEETKTTVLPVFVET